MIELKPCQFCGGLFVSNGVRVLCPKCDATTRETSAVEDVSKVWNRRANG